MRLHLRSCVPTLYNTACHAFDIDFRYDHFAVLCETLPSSVPSMVVNLLATARGFMNQSLRATLNEGLNCSVSGHGGNEYEEDFLNLNNDPFLWDQFSRCGFPGNQFFRYLTTTSPFLPLVIVASKNTTVMWRIRTVLRHAIRLFVSLGCCIGCTLSNLTMTISCWQLKKIAAG